MKRMHICSFDALPTVTQKTTYEELKAAALKVGRFSCFEATDNRWSAGLFTQLCRDPEIETWDMGYPLTGVRKRQVRE